MVMFPSFAACKDAAQIVHGPPLGNKGLRCARFNLRGPSSAAHCFVLHHLHHAAATAHHHRDSSNLHEPVDVVLAVLHSVLAHLHHHLSEACSAAPPVSAAARSRPFSMDMPSRESSATSTQHSTHARILNPATPGEVPARRRPSQLEVGLVPLLHRSFVC